MLLLIRANFHSFMMTSWHGKTICITPGLCERNPSVNRQFSPQRDSNGNMQAVSLTWDCPQIVFVLSLKLSPQIRTNTKMCFITLVLTSLDRFECYKFADMYGRNIFSVTQWVFMPTQLWPATRLRWVAIVMAPWSQSAPIFHIKSLRKLY